MAAPTGPLPHPANRGYCGQHQAVRTMAGVQRDTRVDRVMGAEAMPPGGETGLASETDFLEMYRTLGLRPGCALPELKQAFRRHVARLHPDRAGDVPANPASAAQLQRLIAQYDAAMTFQREH